MAADDSPLCSIGQTFLQFMNNLRKHTLLCDVELKANTKDNQAQSIWAHKVVLLYFSPFFQNLLELDYENSTEVFSVKSACHESLNAVIRLLYQDIALDDALKDEETVQLLRDFRIDLHNQELNDKIDHVYELLEQGLFESTVANVEAFKQESVALGDVSNRDVNDISSGNECSEKNDHSSPEWNSDYPDDASVQSPQQMDKQVQEDNPDKLLAHSELTFLHNNETKLSDVSENAFIRVLVPKSNNKCIPQSSLDSKILQMCKNKIIKTSVTHSPRIKDYSKRKGSSIDECILEKRPKIEKEKDIQDVFPQNFASKDDADSAFSSEDANEYVNVEEDIESPENEIELLIEKGNGETELDDTQHLKSEDEPQNESALGKDLAVASQSEIRDGKDVKEYKGPRDCDICGKTLSCKAVYERHRLIHTGEKPWKCDTCGKSFNAKINLKLHQKTHEKRERAFSCELCDASFYSQHALQHHRRFVHVDEKEFVKCDVCGKLLKSQSNLKVHKQTAHSEPNAELQCQICERQFKTKSYLTKHLRLHENENLYPCRECEKSFRSSHAREKHENMVHKQQVFICELCGNSYHTKAVLNAHISRAHSKDKDNGLSRECEICHKKVGNYYNHIKMHRSYEKGEVHVCPECGKTFPLKAYLHQHMRVHKEAAYKCTNCEKTFTFKSSLQSHLKQGHCNRLSTTDMNRGRFAKKAVKKENASLLGQNKGIRDEHVLPPGVAFQNTTQLASHPGTEVNTVTLVVPEAMLQQLKQETAEVTFQPNGPPILHPAIAQNSSMEQTTATVINPSASSKYHIAVNERMLSNQTTTIHHETVSVEGNMDQPRVQAQQLTYRESIPVSSQGNVYLTDHEGYMKTADTNSHLGQGMDSEQNYAALQNTVSETTHDSHIADRIPEYIDSNLSTTDLYPSFTQSNSDLPMSDVTTSTMETNLTNDVIDLHIRNELAAMEQSARIVTENIDSSNNLATINSDETVTSSVDGFVHTVPNVSTEALGVDVSLQSGNSQLVVSSDDLAELNRIVSVMHTMKEHDSDKNVQYVIVQNSNNS